MYRSSDIQNMDKIFCDGIYPEDGIAKKDNHQDKDRIDGATEKIKMENNTKRISLGYKGGKKCSRGTFILLLF
jgi:hypothetical protein